MRPSENDPLLSMSGSSNSNNKSNRILRKNARKIKRRNCLLLTIAILLLSGVFGIMVVFKYARHISLYHSPGILGRAKTAKAMVRIDPETGVYSMDWDGDGAGDEEYATKIDSDTTTFSELAEIMLQPWYEASLMAVMDDEAWTSSTGMIPSKVREVRKVMLITRDMLDVFSPVFSNKGVTTTTTTIGKKGKRKKYTKTDTDTSLWKKLRTMYKEGYEKLGYLKDLEDLTYSQKLLESRVNAVLEWKMEFIAFQRKHRIRRFLYSPLEKGGGIDPTGCYHHAASHLFWANSDLEDLPCGNDIGTVSLRSLASVQLTHALDYLQEIRNYTTVMPRKNEEQFHNLRKILRIFRDEYNLFGKVLVPLLPPPSSLSSEEEDDDVVLLQLIQEELTILDNAQIKLGLINDQWTAHDVYVKNNSHLKQQKPLAIKTDKLWAKFLVWQADVDLQGCIENVLERMK